MLDSPAVQGPERMGPYRVEQRLGWGTVGEVCVAHREGPGGSIVRVALKRLHPDLAEDPELAAQFRREARVATTLRHPNIVEVIETGEADGRTFLALALVAGTDLASLVLGRRRLGPGVVAAIGCDVASALCHAHALVVAGVPEPVVHGQLSPSNVMVGRDGVALVMDFGSGRALSAAEARQSRIRVGEPWYRAPEQVEGTAIDARVDQFALGVVLFELLTGARPFDGNDEEAVHRALRSGARGPLPQAAGAPLIAVVDRLLMCAPEARFPSMADARAALSPLESAEARRELAALVAQVATAQATHAPLPVGGMLDAETVPRAPRAALPAAAKWDEQDMATTSLHQKKAPVVAQPRGPGHSGAPFTPAGPPPGASPSSARAADFPPDAPPATYAPPPEVGGEPRSLVMRLLVIVTLVFTVVAVGTMIAVRYGCDAPPDAGNEPEN